MLDAESIDVVYTTHACEHFARPLDVLQEEAHRILKNDGYLLIHVLVWWGIEGAHMERVVPIPWCHVFFLPRTSFRTARRVVRSGFYSALAWDFHEAGQRRYDTHEHQEGFGRDYLNRMTRRQFNRYVSRTTKAGRMEVADFELQVEPTMGGLV